MGLGEQRTNVIPGRAYVLPGTCAKLVDSEVVDSWEPDEFSSNGRWLTQLRVIVSAVADGLPGAPGQQQLELPMRRWVQIVLQFAGTNSGPQQHLPAEIHLPVWIDASTRQVHVVDWDTAEQELEPYREVARQHWLETDAPLAPVRAAVAAPREAVRGVKGLFGTWKKEIGQLRKSTGDQRSEQRPVDPAETEQLRRSAIMVRHQLERKPKEFAKFRASALQAAPTYVGNARNGIISTAEFEQWLMYQETTGVVSSDEVERWRQQAAAG